MSNLLVHIADRVLNRPLMIMPDKLAIISSVLEGRIGVEGLAPAQDIPHSTDASRHVGNYDVDPTSSSGAKKPYRTTADGIAIIPIIGSLVGRGGWLQSISGITSYENLKFALNAAANDKTVKSIVLDIDSPGGEAVGAFETADAVRSAAAKKDVISVATGLCCSAAYAIASAATSIITTQSSVMGSIGVVMMHADYSHKLHDAGVVPTLIHAGKKKVDGSPYKPLTDDVKASLQGEVDKFNSLFVDTVVKGRPALTREAVLAMEAGTFIGADAVAAGLADAVGSFETVLADLSQRGTVRNSNSRSYRMSDKTFSQADLDAAVTTARTEATTATTTKLNAEHATALDAATGVARADGAKAERERINGVLSSEDAKGREKSALHLAMTTDMSVETIKGALAGIPKASAAATGSHGLFLTEEPAHTGSKEKKADHGWGDVIADVNKKNAR